MSQHASLTAERWSRFALDQQILMIGNEMNRTTKLLADAEPGPRRRGYERILRLTDLTLLTNTRPALRRELLRWRDLVAALYVAGAADPIAHRAAFRALLQLHPTAARQIPLLLD
jgi:hypothetical protein